MRLKSSSCLHGSVLSVLQFLLVVSDRAQQAAPMTDPTEEGSRVSRQREAGWGEMKPTMSCRCFLHGPVFSMLLLLLPLNPWRAAAQAQQPPQTDPVEAAAVNAILSKLGLSAPPSWNISGNPCSGAATDDTPLDDNPGIKCDCSDRNNTLCHVTRFKINTLDAVGPIPEELRNLTHL